VHAAATVAQHVRGLPHLVNRVVTPCCEGRFYRHSCVSGGNMYRRFARNMANMYTEQQRPSNVRSNLKINLFFYDKEFDSYDGMRMTG
jgi:hypothetical protein